MDDRARFDAETDGDLPGSYYQPFPEETRTASHQTSDGPVTAIFRRWRKGDVALCSLCRLCSARDDACLVVVNGLHGPQEAALLDSRPHGGQAR